MRKEKTSMKIIVCSINKFQKIPCGKGKEKDKKINGFYRK